MMHRAPSPDGSVRFTFDDEEYTLVFDWAAIAFFEREADYPIAEAFADMAEAEAAGRSPKSSHLVFLVQAGLQRHHRGVTMEGAAAMIRDAGVMEALFGGVAEAMPDGDRRHPRGNARARAKGGTGKSSSAKRSKRS